MRPPPGTSRRGAGIDAIDAMKAKPAFAAHHQHVSRAQPHRLRSAAALDAAEAETCGIAKRHRHDRGGEIEFVAVLVKTHPGAVAIEFTRQASGSWP